MIKINLGLRIIVWAFVAAFLFSSSAFALDDPQAKITKVIKKYVVAKYPDWKDLRIRVAFKYVDKTFKSLSQLDGHVDYKIVEVYKNLKPVGNVIFPIKVTAGETTKKIFVRAKVEVWKKIVVAAKKIKRGGQIAAKDLSLVEKDIAMIPNKYLGNVLQAVNTEAKTTIPKGSTIFGWMIKKMPLVHRGSEIAVRVTASNLLVKAQGVALEDGYRGEKIKVKTKNSKKTLEGILISANEVEVKLK
jgi:flagella basal body P-ring formation protein FlgA